MKDYITIRKKTVVWIAATALTAAAAIVLYMLMPFSVKSKPQRIIVRSYNILQADGKDVLYFRSIGADSALTGISTACDSIMFATRIAYQTLDIHAIVERNRVTANRRIATLDSITEELEYYLSVRKVTDEGYDMVAKHREEVAKDMEIANSMKAILDGIGPNQKLEIKHVEISADADSVPFPDVFMEGNGGIWHNGRWLKMCKRGKGMAFDASGQLISGTWNADTMTKGKLMTENGIYHGQFDAHRNAAGHGYETGRNGEFYEGHWTLGLRDGFGFAAGADCIKAGEWKYGKYRGERMNYTSDHIYGIDISRYQHGKGRKYYPIYWNKLRITNLGNISKKTVSGKVDYPVSFVYIKSTEGISVRNKHYANDYKQARKHGIPCGAYHFYSTKSPAASQAKFFIKNSLFRKGDFPPVLDVEPTNAQIMKAGGPEALMNSIRTWMRIVKQHTGVSPILYVNQTFVNKYLGSAPDIKRDYDIWIARYGEYRPDVRLVYWQLCPDGRVDGIHGEVDINVFNGYQDRFGQFLTEKRIK